MGLFQKKEKAPREPQYYVSATNIRTLNYKVYYMKLWEKVLYFLLAFAVGAFVGYLFYGGIGKNEFGEPTMLTRILDISISTITGLAAGKVFLPVRTEQIIQKRRSQLNSQFRDMLEALNTSLGAGKNVMDSFYAVNEDMKVQYEEDAFIINELTVIISGMANNIAIETLLEDFGIRSGIDDIVSFANVFKICYEKGGNIKETIRSTHEILSDKMEIRDDIETVVTANKSEQNLMLVMPVLLIGMIKLTSEDMAANFVTPVGIVASTIAIVLFVVSYLIGKKVLDIKV